MLGGGWDQGSLNVIMAETSNGKCFFEKTKCIFRKKSNNEVFSSEIGKIFTKISKGDSDI